MKRLLWVVMVVAGCEKAPPPGPLKPPVDTATSSQAYDRGQAHFRQGQLEEAALAYRKAGEADPGSFLAWLRYREAMQQLGRGEQVRAEFNARLANAGGNDAFWLVLAAIADPKAEGNVEKAIAKEPGFAWGHFARAAQLAEKGKSEEALMSADRAIALDPANGLFHMARGTALAAGKKRDEAMAAFRKAAELMPDDERPHGAMAAIFADKEQLEEAIAELEKAAKLAPGSRGLQEVLLDLQTKRGLGFLRESDDFLKDGHWSPALDSARKAVDSLKAPADAGTKRGPRLLLMALVQAAAACLGRAAESSRSGRTEEAIAACGEAETWLEDARKRNPTEPETREYLAEAFNRAGTILNGAGLELDEKGSADAVKILRRSREAYRRTLEFAPDNAFAAERIKALSKRLGD